MLVKTNDINLIKQLDDEIFNSSAYQLSTYEQMVSSNLFYLITNDTKQPIGFIIIQKIDADLELIKVGLMEKYRRLGYTYNALLQLIAELSYQHFFLEVKSHNLEAISLYHKLGFEQIGERKNYYSDGSDAIIMQFKK